MVSVYKFATQDKLAEELGDYILQKQTAALSSGSKFTVAISGGSLIKVLYKALIQDTALASRIKWDKWHVYFVDERIVPLEHADSNYGAFKKEVLDKLDSNTLSQLHVYPINEASVLDESKSNEDIAREYEAILPKDLDLLLLGCGPDGHTCSLFPDENHRYLLDERERRVMWCHDSPKPPSDRITITLPVIRDSGAIAFVAEGSSKQDIMHEIFDAKNTKLPTALINSLYGDKVCWFVNDEAFEKVEDKTILV